MFFCAHRPIDPSSDAMFRSCTLLRLLPLSLLTIALLLIPTRPTLAQDAPTQDDLPEIQTLFPTTLQGMEREFYYVKNNPTHEAPFYYRAEASYLNATTDAQAVIDLVAVDAPFATLFPIEIHGARKTALRLAPELRRDPDELEEITVEDQTAYLEPEDDEGGLAAYVPLAEYALLKVRQCCGRTEQDLRALIAALDMQQFRSAATSFAEAGHNAGLWSLLTIAPPTVGGYPLHTFRHEGSETHEIELFYPAKYVEVREEDVIKIMMNVSASALPLKEITMGMMTPDNLEQGLADGLLTPTTLAGRDAYLVETEEGAGVIMTDGAHAFLASYGHKNYVSLETLLEDLTEARIEAFFASAEAIVAEGNSASSDAGAPMCPDEACFEDAFAACRPARFQAEQMGIVAAYEIIEPAGDACRLSLTYERNPNPEWVGQPLYFTATPSPGAPFMDAVQQALNACVEGEASDCDGPLYDLMQP